MRRYFATHLFYMMAMMVSLSILLALGVSGPGYWVIAICMGVIFFSGRHAESVDNHFNTLEKEKEFD